MSFKGGLASEPWTIERALHLALAAIAILGWTVACTALLRQVEAPPGPARESARAKVSVRIALRPDSPAATMRLLLHSNASR